MARWKWDTEAERERRIRKEEVTLNRSEQRVAKRVRDATKGTGPRWVGFGMELETCGENGTRAGRASAACLAHRNIRVLMRWLYNAPVHTHRAERSGPGGVGQSVSQSQSASRCRLCAERSSFLLVFFLFFFYLISSIPCDVLIQWPRRSFWSQRDSPTVIPKKIIEVPEERARERERHVIRSRREYSSRDPPTR